MDAAVAKAFLKTVRPSNLKVAFRVFEKIEENCKTLLRHWELRIEKARFEADRAARQFHAVEPENRLVARTLEAEWNKKLEALDRLQRDFQAEMAKAPLSLTQTQREQIMALSKDLPSIWNASSTTHEDRKRLVRVLIKDVALTKERENSSVRVQI